MSPRPADLDPDAQAGLAYAAFCALERDEREALLLWMTEYMPRAFLLALEGLRWQQQLADGWDQGD